MSYISFNEKTWQTIPEEVDKEYLIVNSIGAYSSSTLANLNTRKYHGVFVVPQPKLGDANHGLLSNLDEAVICGDRKFDLAVHQYPGKLHPKGHLLLRNFLLGGTPTWIYGNRVRKVSGPGSGKIPTSHKIQGVES